MIFRPMTNDYGLLSLVRGTGQGTWSGLRHPSRGPVLGAVAWLALSPYIGARASVTFPARADYYRARASVKNLSAYYRARASVRNPSRPA